MKREIAITVDVETDWGGRLPVADGNCYGLEKGLDTILATLSRLRQRATFFVSGELAEKKKEIIRRIDEADHEVAAHGYSHLLDYRQLTYKKILDEVRRSRHVLEDIMHKEVIGFRSPGFKSNTLLFKALESAQLIYDSSLVRSFLPAKYHNLKIPEHPYRIEGRLTEIPISGMPIMRIPYGILWINLLGHRSFNWLYNNFEKKELIVFYLHPFDLLREKTKQDFHPVVRIWYTFKSDQAEQTFKQLMDTWVGDQSKFVLLSEIARRMDEGE